MAIIKNPITIIGGGSNKLAQVADGSVTSLTAEDLRGATKIKNSLCYSSIIDPVSLTSVTIPNSVVTIGNAAFTNCASLTSLTFESPSSLTTIEYRAFENCTGLTDVTIPSSVTTLQQSAFMNCLNLSNITFESGSQLTTIGVRAFSSLNLTSITLPATVTNISSYAFEDCGDMTSFTILATTPPIMGRGVFDSEDGYVFPIYVPAESVQAYKTATNWSNYAGRIRAIPSN